MAPGVVTPAQAVQSIIEAFVLFSASLHCLFSSSFTAAQQEGIWSRILQGRKALLKAFYFNFAERPNIHLGVHFSREVHLHGTAHQTEVSVKEMVHKRPKATAAHGNHKQIAKTMLLNENADQALKFLLHGGVDGLIPGKDLLKLVEDVGLKPVFQGWLKGSFFPLFSFLFFFFFFFFFFFCFFIVVSVGITLCGYARSEHRTILLVVLIRISS